MPPSLAGKTALVTGASRGIGRAVALRLATHGARVVVNYRADEQAAHEVVERIHAMGGDASAVQADVTDPAAIGSLVDQTVRLFGRLDIAVSNAGVEHFGPLDSITVEDFDRVYTTNVRGQLFVAQHAARVTGKGSSIVLTSSVSAHIKVLEHTLYASSKAAVEAMVAQLSIELGARGIRINAVAPGGTQTDMAADVAHRYAPPGVDASVETVVNGIALGRLAQPEEIAAAVAFLASDDASYATGSTLCIDGGLR